MISSELRIRVRYMDIDRMGIVYHTRYLDWCEWGRTELLRQLGMPYRELENQGLSLPVSEAYFKYRKGARYDDWVIVKSLVKEKPKASIKIEYQVYGETQKEILVTGYTVHAFVAGDKVTRIPKEFAETLFRQWKE